MTNNEILQSNLLNIIFENRNKDYGAYALRRGYNVRLLAAMGAAMSVILLFVFINMLNTGKKSSAPVSDERKEVVIRTIHMSEEKQKEPEKPKEIVKQKPAPKVAEIKFTSPPEIKKDNQVKETMPPVEALSGKVTSTQNVAGMPDDGKEKEKTVVETVNGNGTGPSKPESEFLVNERDPEFPGGLEALKKFLAKNLNTPGELEAGEKKMVQIRFKVDKDGSVTTFEIVTSGGGEFDSEVVRVCKKMPHWTPAIQNGLNVPVSYILPITFVGVEQ